MNPSLSRFLAKAVNTRRISHSPNLRARLERCALEDQLPDWLREECLEALREDRALRRAAQVRGGIVR